MEYPAVSGNKLTLSAVTPSPTKEVEVTWTIQNFKMLTHSAMARRRTQIQPVPNASPNVASSFDLTDYTFPLEVKMNERADIFQVKLVMSVNFEKVGIYFKLLGSSSPVWMATFSAAVVVNNKEKISVGATTPVDFKQATLGLGWGWANFLRMQNVDSYLTAQGTLNIKIKIVRLIDSSSGSNEPSPLLFNYKLNTDFRTLFLEDEFTDIQIKVSLGREKTFKCHKAIVAARSPVFRAMFRSDNLENYTGVVEIPDVSAEVMEQFLCYLYSGYFTTDLSSSWVPLLPQIVEVADKYCVLDLVEFCDINLIGSVTTENAVELISLAKRLRLKQATKDLESFITMTHLQRRPNPQR